MMNDYVLIQLARQAEQRLLREAEIERLRRREMHIRAPRKNLTTSWISSLISMMISWVKSMVLISGRKIETDLQS